MMYADDVKLCLPLTNTNSHGSSDLERINSVTELRVLFNHNFNLTDHIGIKVNKAKGVFAFVKH